jgi:WASH complex subunit strumpellin
MSYSQLFAGITRYHDDTLRFLSDLDAGLYVAHSLEALLRGGEARQLLVEALAQCAQLPLLLDARLGGRCRERLVIAHLRCRGGAPDAPRLDDVVRLCRSSGFDAAQHPPAPRPRGYPEEYLARFEIPGDVVHLVLGRLRLDDVYNATAHYPSPAHRGAALAQQGAAAYVLLYLVPELLHGDGAAMRELVDRHFADAWVLPWAPGGHSVDLTVAWEPYRAARAALDTAAPPAAARRLAERHAAQAQRLAAELPSFLADGVLTEEFLLNNAEALLAAVRDANVSVRWLLLHAAPPAPPPPTARGAPPRLPPPPGRLASAVASRAPPLDDIASLLLDTAALEEAMKRVATAAVGAKDAAWGAARDEAAGRIRELADFFSGSSGLSRAPRDDALRAWFSGLADTLTALPPDRPVATGRKLQQIVTALTEVEGFRAVDASLPTRAYLADTRAACARLLRLLHVGAGSLATLAAVADAGWAWGPAHALAPRLRARLAADPAAVHRLRCLFLKLRTMMELPLLRPGQAASPDVFALSQFYSGLLVDYAADVLAVVPDTMFDILTRTIAVHAGRLRELPTRLEKATLKEAAQLDERYRLAEATHAVAVFTQGVLAMERTFMGVLELDPRALLQAGIRAQVCTHLARAVHEELRFSVAEQGFLGSSVRPATAAEFEARLGALAERLTALRASFEYIQDYVNVTGLRIWQEELGRVAADALRCERGAAAEAGGAGATAAGGDAGAAADAYADAWDDYYDSDADDDEAVNASAPRPRVPRLPAPAGDTHRSWLGRVAAELLRHTAPPATVYLPSLCAWFAPGKDGTDAGAESVGMRTFCGLRAAIGLPGLAALDALLAARLRAALRGIAAHYRPRLAAGGAELLAAAQRVLGHPSTLPDVAPGFYADACARAARAVVWGPLLEALATAGQLALLRRQLAAEAAHVAGVDAPHLAAATSAVADALAAEARAAARRALRARRIAMRSKGGAAGQLPPLDDPVHTAPELCADVAALLGATGARDPLLCRYDVGGGGSSSSLLELDELPALLFFFTVSQLPRYVACKRLGCLRPGRRHMGAAPDAAALAAGAALALRQASPATTEAYLALLGQFCRVHAQTAAAALVEQPDTAPTQQPQELVTAVGWCHALVRVGAMPAEAIRAHVPPHLLDTVLGDAPAPRR